MEIIPVKILCSVCEREMVIDRIGVDPHSREVVLVTICGGCDKQGIATISVEQVIFEFVKHGKEAN